MILVTIYALFGDDFRVLTTPVEADEYFYSITTISLVLFLVEIFFASIAKENYFLGFYFWLDLISTISLVTDIGWIMDLLTGDSTKAKGAQ
jgi:hypothetical protein